MNDINALWANAVNRNALQYMWRVGQPTMEGVNVYAPVYELPPDKLKHYEEFSDMLEDEYGKKERKH